MPQINPKRIAREEQSIDRQALLGGTPSPSLPYSGPFAPQRKNALSFVTYQVSQPSPGNPVQLPNVVVPDGFTLVIRAYHTNKGIVYIGNTQTNAKAATGVCARIYADGIWTISIQNANAAWIDTDYAGEGVEVACEQ